MLDGHNFHYQLGCDIDYDTEYPGCGGCDGTDSDYCRCGNIVGAKVTQTPSLEGELIKEIYGKLNEIDVYCINRILSCDEFWNKDNWEVETDGGYYGDEVRGVYFLKGQEVDKQVDELRGLNHDFEKIQYILKLEYGHILEELEGLHKVTIKDILKDRLILSNKEHYQKLNKGVVNSYKKYSLPRGIFVPNGKLYRIIDGYHRCAAAEEEIVKIIVLE